MEFIFSPIDPVEQSDKGMTFNFLYNFSHGHCAHIFKIPFHGTGLSGKEEIVLHCAPPARL
jgi:hypothetical protein